MDERPDSSQQLMDILLVMDEKGTLQAVSGVKDGELQTKNPLEDNNDLLRVEFTVQPVWIRTPPWRP